MRKVVLFLIILGVCIVIFLIGFQAKKFVKAFNELGKIEISDTSYTLKSSRFIALNIRTNRIDTIELDDKKIINFWATWCKPCINEMPSFLSLKEHLNDAQIILLTFDSLALKHATLSKYNITLPAYFLRDTTFFSTPQLIPKTLLLKKDTVLREYLGEQNWSDSYLIKEIDSISR